MPRPTISALCPTAHPGPLVAASLRLLREAVDEIVIAADSRVQATDLAHYASVADVLVRYEYAGANRHWPWLHRQAGGAWVLVLDGDELASAALIEALPELVADCRICQYSLPIHWPWPAPDVRLAEEPWASDRRLRLLRNGPGLAFAAHKHALAEVDPPIRFIDELPVYHLDLLLPDRARREAKVVRYDEERFGLLTPEGVGFNEALYLPEVRDGHPITVPVPVDDVRRIAHVLGAGENVTRGGPDNFTEAVDPQSFPLLTREVIAWHAPRAELSADAYRAALRLARPLPAFIAGRPGPPVWLEVTNAGSAHWPGGERREPRIRLGVSWQPASAGTPDDRARVPLPYALDPGQSALIPVEVHAPALAGPAELRIDLVHEDVRWFGCAVIAQVEVGPSVAERLGALVDRHGALIPHAAVMQERRAVGARDGLVRPEPADAAPADRRIAELIASLPAGTRTLAVATIDRLVELVRADWPETIVEFGSGTSTVVLATLLAERYRNGPRLLSLEEHPAWAQRIRVALAERELEPLARVLHVPIGERAGGPVGYQATAEAAAVIRRLRPKLVLVDGPKLDSGATALGVVDLVAPHVRGTARLLLNHALRDTELCVAAAWQQRGDVVLHGIRPTANGLLEATLSAPERRRQRFGEYLRGRLVGDNGAPRAGGHPRWNSSRSSPTSTKAS